MPALTMPTNAIALGQIGPATRTVSDRVTDTNRDDYFRFSVDRTSTLRVTLSGLSYNADLYLYDIYGTLVAGSRGPGTALDSLLAKLAAGTYFLRVTNQTKNATNYQLTMAAEPVDLAGNSSAAARVIGSLSAGAVTFQDWVGLRDTADYYRFSLGTGGDVTLGLFGLSAAATLTLFDSANSSVAGTPLGGRNFYQDLAAGTYFVRVAFAGTNTPDATTYTLQASASVDVGTLGATATSRTGVINSGDLEDVYRFTLDAAATVAIQATDLGSVGATMELLDDRGTFIAGRYDPTNLDAGISQRLAAGAYLVRVRDPSVAGSAYQLDLSAVALSTIADTAGNSAAAARRLGTLGAAELVVRELVSRADPDDFYRFEVDRITDLRLTLGGLSADADLQLLNASGGVIAQSLRGSTDADLIGFDNLLPGSYRVRVFGSADPAAYALRLLALPGLGTDTEPGNTLATAKALGALATTPVRVTDQLSGDDGQDFYQFQLTEPGRLAVTLSGLQSDADLQVLDANGKWLASSLNQRTAGESIALSLNAGTYHVRVYTQGGPTHYELGLTTTPTGATAPAAAPSPDTGGNTLATARDLGKLGVAGQTIQEWIGPGDLNDYYRFTVTTKVDLTLRMDGMTAGTDLQVLDRFGSRVGQNLAVGADSETLRLDGLAPGSYYLRAFTTTATPSRYTITVAAPPPAADQGGNQGRSRDLPLPVAQPDLTILERVGPNDPVDEYRINLGGITRDLTVSVQGMSADADLELYDRAGRTIQTSRLGGLDDDTVVALDLPGGLYLVRVRSLTQATDYQLKLSSAAPPADLAGNTMATARVVTGLGPTEQSFADRVGSGDPFDYYTFTLGSAARLDATLTSVGPGADLVLYDAAGRQVTHSDNPGATQDGLGRELAAGTYYLRVSGGAPTAPYTLNLSAPPLKTDHAGSAAATARTLGTIGGSSVTVRDGIGATGDTIDVYAITLTDTVTALTLSLTGLAADATLSLLDAAEAELATSANAENADETVTESALAAGTYYVQVIFAAADGATPYTLTIDATTTDVVPDRAGDTAALARDLGVLGGTEQIVADSLGPADSEDWYQFSLPGAGQVTATVAGTAFDGSVTVRAADGTTVLSTMAGTDPLTLDLAAGAYYLTVAGTGATVDYALTVGVQTGDAGSALDQATVLGTIGRTETARTSWVGTADPADTYQFTLETAGTLQLSLDGLDAPASLSLLNATGDTLAAAAAVAGDSNEVIRAPLSAGTYHVQVRTNAALAHYTLRLAAAPLPAAAVTGATTSLLGGRGDDQLTGAATDDLLAGGPGSDRLTGGAGADRFRFANLDEGGDTITDFVAGTDRIELVSPNFGGLPAGTVAAGRFALDQPRDADDYFIFNTNTGALLYDRDGNRAGAAVTLATLSVTTLAASDLLIAAT